MRPEVGIGDFGVLAAGGLVNSYESGDKRKGWSVMPQGYSNPNWKNSLFPSGFTYDTTVGGGSDDAYHTTNGTRSNSLKYINGPAVNGSPSDPTSAFGTGLNLYLLRYADVLLIYAEAVLGNNNSTT